MCLKRSWSLSMNYFQTSRQPVQQESEPRGQGLQRSHSLVMFLGPKLTPMPFPLCPTASLTSTRRARFTLSLHCKPSAPSSQVRSLQCGHFIGPEVCKSSLGFFYIDIVCSQSSPDDPFPPHSNIDTWTSANASITCFILSTRVGT